MNHFGGSLGGPIVHNKLFFFFDSEWVRIALPIVTATTVPTPLPELRLAATSARRDGLRHRSELSGRAAAGAVLSEDVFAVRKHERDAARRAGLPVQCGWSRAPAVAHDGNGCANRQSVSHSSDDHEQVQTARIDYNIDEKNTAWFRFQADTGLQAAYTDPDQSAVRRGLSAAAVLVRGGLHARFFAESGELFQSGFSWYESLFGPSDFQKTLAAFPIVLQGSGANAPFTTIGGLDNTWVQGRRATRFFINDNLAWSHGAHEFRFGTNTRIFRLNDYDFGEGTVPTVTYTTLPQFIYGVASTATETFPTSANEPFNFLNLDLYAQDTWKVTPKPDLDVRHARHANSNPLNPHDADRAPCRLVRFHLARCQSAAECRRSRRTWAIVFASTPLAILQPRTAIAWQFAPDTVLRTGFGIFSDILPGSVADVVGINPPYVQDVSGRAAGHGRRNGHCAGSAEQRGRRHRGRQSSISAQDLRKASFPARLRRQIRRLPSAGGDHGGPGRQASRAIFHGVEPRASSISSERTASLRAQYVGTRAVNQPYLTQVNGYQTVCQGCFAPFPYVQPTDPRFGAVTQLSTGANSHYNGLQLTADEAPGAWLQGQVNYTLSRCMDTVSNGGFLQFSAGGILSPLPGILRATMDRATTTSATTSTRSMSTNCPSKSRIMLSATR